MLEMLKRLAADESGATAIEYGLIVALVAMVAITGMTAFGGSTTAMFNYIRDQIIPAVSG